MSDLFEQIYALRDAERERLASARLVLKGNVVPWEESRLGRVKWFLHPALEDRAVRSLMVFLQEIGPGGCSATERIHGGRVMFVLKGRGYTLIDGVRQDWHARDLVLIPVRPAGVVYQHVNLADDEPAQLLNAEPNLIGPLGLEMGADMEVLEPARH